MHESLTSQEPTQFEQNQERLRSLEPAIIDAHTHYIRPEGRTPISSSDLLASAAKTEADPLAYNPVLRAAQIEHTKQWEDAGLDIKATNRAILLVDLLTEDNIVHYSSLLERMAVQHGAVPDSPFSVMSRSWLADEYPHGRTMAEVLQGAGYIATSGLVEPTDYSIGMTSQIETGIDLPIVNLGTMYAYTDWQEVATRISHRRHGFLVPKVVSQVLRRIAGDENVHHKAFNAVHEADLTINTDQALIDTDAVYSPPTPMPGERGIPSFDDHATLIALAGIFDAATREEIKRDILNKAQIEQLEPASDDAKAAQERLMRIAEGATVERAKRQMNALRSRAYKSLRNNSPRLLPMILGHTFEPITRTTTVEGKTIHQWTGVKPIEPSYS